jgi:hypothetical protein
MLKQGISSLFFLPFVAVQEESSNRYKFLQYGSLKTIPVVCSKFPALLLQIH